MSREFRSADGRFGLRFTAGSLRRLLALCEQGWPRETGGILVGFYTPDLGTAVVTRVQGPPADSQRDRTRFVRGVQGLRSLLTRLWHRRGDRRRYYLGEWHLHPGAAPTPSPIDVRQMHRIAEGPYACPEPVLVVVGGAPGEAGWVLEARVFRQGGEEVMLRGAEADAEKRRSRNSSPCAAGSGT